METEDDIKKKHAGFVIGQELSSLSLEDLDELVELLSDEITRLKETRGAKSEHISAAEALFNSKS